MRIYLASLVVVIGYGLWVWALFRFANREWLIILLTLTIIAPLVYLALDRFVQKNRLLQTREQAYKAELALLKNQIHPHFFFNTLNNLYGLVQQKSDLAPEMMLRLSDLMRFSLYEGKKDHVSLTDEIAYLENYLTLQKIRIQKRVEISFEKSGEDVAIQIPPLLLIMLVENAFKHGVASLTEGAWVHLSLKASPQSLVFQVKNRFDPNHPKKPAGIGLANLQRRLDLLFPKRHQISVGPSGDVFTANLVLDLS